MIILSHNLKTKLSSLIILLICCPFFAFSQDESDDIRNAYNQAWLYAKNGDYREAADKMKIFCDAWSISNDTTSNLYAKHLNNLAYFYAGYGNYRTAALYEEKVLHLREGLLPCYNKDYIATLNNLAKYYFYNEKQVEATQLKERQCSIIKQYYGEKEEYISNIETLATYYYKIGDTSKSILLLQNLKPAVIRAFKATDDRYLSWQMSLAVVYMQNGNRQTANEICHDILKKINVADIQQSLTTYINLITMILSANNEIAAVEDILSACENYYTANNDISKADYAIYLNNTAEYFATKGQYLQSKLLRHNAISIYDTLNLNNTMGYANLLNNLAQDYCNLGEYKSSVNIAKQALSIISQQRPMYDRDYINALHTITVASLEDDDINNGLKYLREELDNTLVSIGTNLYKTKENDRFEYIQTISDIKDLPIYYAIGSIDGLATEIAYDASLNLKNLLISSSKDNKNYIVNQEYLNSIYRVIRSKRMLNNSYSAELDSLETQVLSNINSQKAIVPCTWMQVAQSLEDNEIAVEFATTTDQDVYVAYVLRKNWDSPRYVYLGELGILSKYLDNPNEVYTSNEVANVIWKRILEEGGIKYGETIYFSPDGIINIIAIENLIIDNHSISSLYPMHRVASTGQLHYDTEIKSIAMFGYNASDDVNPNSYRNSHTNIANLTHSNNELTRIKAEFENNLPKADCNIYIGAKNAIKNLVSFDNNSPSILHFSTHGYFENALILEETNLTTHKQNLFFRQLRNSGLIFYDSIANKNVTISSYELSQLNFVGTSLAVLGTCYSANGELTIDGVAGLQYGFKSAGVRSLIMSLWDADDASTSYFMQTFYASLVRGQTIKQSYDEALTETKIKFESPYYWAGFILLE
jgi:hypothetical protein